MLGWMLIMDTANLRKKSEHGLNGRLVFGDPPTWRWLEAEGLWPEEWGIPTNKAAEIEKLYPRPVLIPVVNTALRCFTPNEALFASKNRPIFVSNLLLGKKHYNFTREEKIAAMLHEIGHVRYDGKGGAEGEDLADSFVNECGFGKAMVGVLDTLIKVDKELLGDEAVRSYEERKKKLL
jgi:hypothetical protein